ncbi:hypothetical protein RND71_038891 [Anisodus tanguticus]|uniref:Uncharacterized protein n=1 Tax=Anisodus tanguticus TaxID=243964 RepID=A0AAE1UZY3_9SOLA|nr:hypothetical protein RND71_038891 [Anisodus tanguticus]
MALKGGPHGPRPREPGTRDPGTRDPRPGTQNRTGGGGARVGLALNPSTSRLCEITSPSWSQCLHYHHTSQCPKIEFTKGQTLNGTTTKQSQDMQSIIDQIKQSQDLARGTLINTFEELEPWYVDEYKKVVNKVFCVGPVSLCNKEMDEMVDRGNMASIDEHSICLNWLHSMKPKSVIYACFGSLCNISFLQMKELD